MGINIFKNNKKIKKKLKNLCKITDNIDWKKNRNLHTILILDMILNKKIIEPYNKNLKLNENEIPLISKLEVKLKLTEKIKNFNFEENENDNKNENIYDYEYENLNLNRNNETFKYSYNFQKYLLHKRINAEKLKISKISLRKSNKKYITNINLLIHLIIYLFNFHLFSV